MTSRGPFQPKTFYDSMILRFPTSSFWNQSVSAPANMHRKGKSSCKRAERWTKWSGTGPWPYFPNSIWVRQSIISYCKNVFFVLNILSWTSDTPSTKIFIQLNVFLWNLFNFSKTAHPSQKSICFVILINSVLETTTLPNTDMSFSQSSRKWTTPVNLKGSGGENPLPI